MKWIIAIIILFLIWIFWDYKFSKQAIAELYGITKKTLNKWVRHLLGDSFIEFWNSKRKFTIRELKPFVELFGLPLIDRSYSKGEIKNECEMRYATLRENVFLNEENIGISYDTYRSLDIFPPKVSAAIIQVMG